MAKKKNNKTKKDRKLLRKNQITVYLNDKELYVLRKFMKKYKIKSTGDLVRQTLFTHILEKMTEDYPTIFPTEDDKK